MSIFKLAAGVLFNVAVFGVCLFVPAGTLDWWRAWVFLGVVFVGAVATTAWLYHANTGVLEERFKPPVQKGQPLADKILIVPFLAAFLGVIVFIPLDVFWFHLLAEPGPFVSAAGLVLFGVGWWIMSLAARENAFASPAVKHQAERNQRVVDSGVYAVVRHPMYSGAALFLVGMPLWLESYAAAILASVPIGMLALRILIEERFLRRELAGYAAYTEQTRYRLIPYVW